MFTKGSYGNSNVGHTNLLWICICEDAYITQLSSHPSFFLSFFLRGIQWCSQLLSDLMVLWPNWAFLDPTVMFWVGSGLNLSERKPKAFISVGLWAQVQARFVKHHGFVPGSVTCTNTRWSSVGFYETSTVCYIGVTNHPQCVCGDAHPFWCFVAHLRVFFC